MLLACATHLRMLGLPSLARWAFAPWVCPSARQLLPMFTIRLPITFMTAPTTQPMVRVRVERRAPWENVQTP
jgi:hypothetical protein